MADYSIVGDTRLDASGFNKGLSAMSVAAGNLISGLVKTGTSKIAELTQASVGVGMSFQSSMSQVAATMGTSVDQIQNLTDKAKEMGSTTAFTATQAADALNYLALAGYDADKAAEVLPSVLNLAAAGGMDLAYASDLVTDAMASLNIEANKQNVDAFGNKLAMAASKANANVSQLGEAILTVGGTAANLREGTTELTTALCILANVGSKGAEGGTHLRNIILSLQSPTKDASAVMDELGLEVYDAQGNMRGLDDILTDLNDTMDGMTQGQKDSTINALFNKTDLAAVNGLLAAQGETWETLADQIDAAGEAAGDSGAMAQMAETQLDNLQGSVTIMQSALEGLQLGIYEYLEPSLNDAAKWGAECFTTLTKALTDGGPEALLQAAGQIISDLSSSISAQLPGLTEAAVEIIAQLATDVVAATPQLLSSGAEILSALVQGLRTALPQLAAAGIEMIAQLSAGLAQGIPEILAQALPIVADFASGLRENVGQLVDAGIDLILSLAQGLIDGLPALIEYLPGIISDIAGVINDNAPKILEAGIQLILMLGKGLLQAVPTLVANIPQICQALFDVFTAFRWMDIGKQIVDGLWKGLTSGWTALTKKVGDLVQQLPDIAKRVLGIHSPSKVFSEIGLNICRGLAAGLENGTPETEEAAKQVIASVTDTATQITDGVTSLVETTTDILADGTEQQKQVITSTGTEIIDGVKRTVKTVTTIAADGTKTVTKTIEDAGPQYASAAELLTSQFRTKLEDGWQQIESDIQTDALGAIETLAKAIQNGDLEQLGLWAAEYFWNACTNEQKQQIQALALGALNQLSSALSGVGTNLAALASSLVAKFVPAAATATGAQEGLNIAMDANPIMLVISLIGMLVGALVNFASTNKSVASAIKNVWNGLADFMSIIFEGVLRVAGLAIEGFILTINSLISAYNAIPGVKKIDKAKNPLWNGADKLAADRKQRQEERSAQSKLDAQYEADTSAIEKKQMEAQYAKKKAELEKAKLSSDDPGMLDAEKAIAKADYEKDLADLEKKLIDAEYEKASAELAKKSTKDKEKLAELEKQILAADNTLKTGAIEKELLKLDYEKTLKELEDKYNKTSSSTDKSPEPDTDPSLPDNTDAIKDNTDALLAANAKLAEMVRQADSLVLSDKMAVTRTVAASGTAQVAAAANSYVREGDTTVVQNIYSKAQTAADLQREARWEADRGKAQKH